MPVNPGTPSPDRYCSVCGSRDLRCRWNVTPCEGTAHLRQEGYDTPGDQLHDERPCQRCGCAGWEHYWPASDGSRPTRPCRNVGCISLCTDFLAVE